MPYMKYSKAEMNDLLLEKDLKLKERTKVVKKRRRMKTGKLAFLCGFIVCIILIAFSMAMVVQGKDTQTVAIFASAGVICITVMFGIYEKFSTVISLKNMDKNYIENYDEKEGIR